MAVSQFLGFSLWVTSHLASASKRFQHTENVSLPLFPDPSDKSFHVSFPQSSSNNSKVQTPSPCPARSTTANRHTSENRPRRVVVSIPATRTTARARTPPRDNCRTLTTCSRGQSLADAQNSQRPPNDPSAHHPENITPRPRRLASSGHDAPHRSRTETQTSQGVAPFSQR